MSFRFVTYNVWHGLSGEGVLRFKELEPAGRKQKRMKLQVEELSALDPDVLFLQEVNPIASGSRFYANELGLEEVHQLDQAGIEIFGYGFPTNLKTGLCTAARPELAPVKLKGLKLSGSSLGWLGDRLSFQLKEFRYGLFARVKLGPLSVLTVNLHLHHGPTMTDTAEERLEKLVDDGIVRRELAEKTREAMFAAVLRRHHEMDRIVRQIRKLRRRGEEVVIAGDFNCWGEELAPLESAGFVNVTERRIERPSWDGATNSENHKYSRELVSPFPYYGNPALLEFIRLTIDEPRMLDHFLMSEELAKRVVSASRVLDRAAAGLLGSDHYGLTVTID